MRKLWIKFGCFLIGYNYAIVAHSSEVSVKAVKRYTSALLIVCILWAFIGYSFTQRYIHGGALGSIAGGLAFIVIIIQIERQIILAHQPSKWLYVFRGLIAMMMAILGAIIIDQIIFKEDIELKKISSISDKVNAALPPKTEELRTQISDLDTAIAQKEAERQKLLSDISLHPTSVNYTNTTSTTREKNKIKDSTGNEIEVLKPVTVNTTTSTTVPNPKTAFIGPLDELVKGLRLQKAEKENALVNIRSTLEKEISSKTGFLDELEVMFRLIKGSLVAFVVYAIWFLFLMGLEMLVMISKVNEKENDYDKTVNHHMELQKKRLELLYVEAIRSA